MRSQPLSWPSQRICVALSLVTILGVACGGPSPTTPGGQQTARPITIGIALSLSGDFQADGNAFKQGYQLWAQQVNTHGGLLGRKVVLDILDDGSSPDQVQIRYQQLITVHKVDLVFGPFSTVLTKAASLVARQYGYAMLEGAGGGPSVFNRGLDNVFDVSLPVARALGSFAHYVLSLPLATRPTSAAYASQDDPFTQPQVEQARGLLEQGGIKTRSWQIYPAGTSDEKPIADSMIISGAQVVVCGTLLSDISAFVRQFQRLHYNPSILLATAGPDQGQSFLQAVGGARIAEGILFPNGWYPQLKTIGNTELVKAYLAIYGGAAQQISADVAEAYSVGQVAFQAVSQNQSLQNGKLIARLHSGKVFQSVQGPVSFDPTGQNSLAQAYLFQWQHGNVLPIYPKSAALAPPEFPRPHWP